MDRNSYFWIGAGSSGAIYALLVVIVLFTATHTPKKIQLSGQSIAVDMIMAESQKNIAQMPRPQTTPEPVQKTAPVKEESVSLKREPLLKHEEKKPTLNDAKNILKNFEAKPTLAQPKQEVQKESQSAKSLLSSLTLKKNVPTITFSSVGSNANEYLGRIAGLIKANWQPYKNDAGLTAIISMNIKADGSFDYTIKRASLNADFNERLNAYMKEIKTKGLPPPDDKKSVSVDFNFIAKE
jgi:outer membrane biosynthesis protein TonB